VGKGLFEFGDVDGDAGGARLQHPLGVAWRDGQVWVADTYNSRIKVIDPVKRRVSAVAGSGKKAFADGKAAAAAFDEPGGLAWLGGKLYIADTNNHQVRVYDPAARTVSSLELKGLERLSRGRMDRFRGRILDLGEREVKAGSSELALNITLPAGYKFNLEAPFYMRWRASEADGLRFRLQPDQVDFKKVDLPFQVPFEQAGGRAELTIDTVVYYCTPRTSACYVDPIRVKLATRATEAGAAVTPIEIPVKKPGMG
ncbi:MAG TPA: hypothetical protein VLH09_08865, partial [Bryobacteraceae bacterium]|nr:hypothetical protein [Bryobacteraceae bacterium]